MTNDILNTIFDLIKIKSISGNEAEIAKVLQYCRDFFKGSTATIREFKYKDASPVLLIANHGGDDFDILISGHLDVVPADDTLFEPSMKEDKIFGRGAGDMKSQIAVALYNMKYVIENNLPIKLGILITTDEETSSNGIKAFVKAENITPKIVVDCDAGNLYTIVEKYKHSVGVKIKATGISGHSSTPWEGINAIEELMLAIGRLQQHFARYSKQLPTPSNTWVNTMAVTGFGSPITANVIPAQAEAWINFRLTDELSLDGLKAMLDTACKNTVCHYEISQSSCGCYMDASSEIIQAYKKLAEEVIGKEVTISHMNGATDARMFAEKSVIIMHSINFGNHHSPGEYAEIQSIYQFMDIQKKFIELVSKRKLA